MKLDQFKNEMHFDVPGIGFLGSPFVALERQEAHEQKPKKGTPMQIEI